MSHQILNVESIIALAMWFVPLLVLITVVILAAISIISERRKVDAEFKFDAVVVIFNKFFPKRKPKDRT